MKWAMDDHSIILDSYLSAYPTNLDNNVETNVRPSGPGFRLPDDDIYVEKPHVVIDLNSHK